MNIDDVNKRLYESGEAAGMCTAVREKWTSTLTEDQLIDLWFDNYDFALTNHYPSNAVIAECFGKETLRRHNVILDDVWSILNPPVAMLLGDSESTARFNAYHVGQIFVRDNSRLNLIARDHASVTVCVMDCAEVSIVNYNGTARVLVMKYSPTAKVVTDGNGGITVRENYDYLRKKISQVP